MKVWDHTRDRSEMLVAMEDPKLDNESSAVGLAVGEKGRILTR